MFIEIHSEIVFIPCNTSKIIRRLAAIVRIRIAHSTFSGLTAIATIAMANVLRAFDRHDFAGAMVSLMAIAVDIPVSFTVVPGYRVTIFRARAFVLLAFSPFKVIMLCNITLRTEL
jgi:hypothetical protein